MYKNKFVAVIIPTYKAKDTINNVIAGIRSLGDIVDHIYVVDDKCPEDTWSVINQETGVHIIKQDVNLGVGGAVKTGYMAGLKAGVDLFIKMDADGQMNPKYITKILDPICDDDSKFGFAKGNRFTDKIALKAMPWMRLFGNLSLSHIVRVLSGHSSLQDVTNGYTAITRQGLSALELHKIDNRYYFEIDMIFNLAKTDQNICDIDMPAKYNNEVSSLSIWNVLFEFPPKIIKSYFLRISSKISN